MNRTSPSGDIANITSLFHLFTPERSMKCGIPNGDRIINKAVNSECRNFPGAVECFLPTIDSPPINFSRKSVQNLVPPKETLSIRKSPYKTTCRDIAFSDLVMRSERIRAKVLEKRRMASVEVQVYNILKTGQVRV